MPPEASRAFTSRDVVEPPWLTLSPRDWPRRPDINQDRELPDLKTTVLLVHVEVFPLWSKYSSHDHLLRVVAWCRRFAHNCRRKTKELHHLLTADELQAARLTLLERSQHESYSDVVSLLKAGKELHILLSLRPLLGKDSLLRVGGRLEHSGPSLPVHTPHHSG